MITQKVAEQVKQDYLNLGLSELERLGIFESEETKLTAEETLALSLINRLNSEQTIEFYCYLNEIEDHQREAEVYDDSKIQRDLDRLVAKGIDFRDNKSMSFIYGLLAEKLEENESQFKQLPGMAKMKAVALAQNQRLIVEPRANRLVDQDLKDIVEQEVRKVENYLTRYFTIISPILNKFLPIEFEVGKPEGGKYVIELSNQDGGFVGLTILAANIDFWQRRYGRGFVEPTGLEISHLPVNYWADERYNTSIRQKSISSNLIHFKLSKEEKLFNQALYGQSFESPSSFIKYEYKKEGTFTIPFKIDGWFDRNAKRNNLKRTKKIFQGQGRLNWELYSEKPAWHSFFDQLKCNHELIYQTNPEQTEVEITILARTGIKVDEEKLLETAQPLFCFKYFSPEQYNLKNYKQFWNELNAYAQLPIAITTFLNECFKDNYLTKPQIELDSYVAQIETGLQELKTTLGECETNGRLPESTAKLLTE